MNKTAGHFVHGDNDKIVTIHSHYLARCFHAFFHENPGQWARNMTDRAYFCAFCYYEQRSCE